MDGRVSTRTVWSGLVVAALIGLSACSWPNWRFGGEPVPRDPGLYAIPDGGAGDTFVRLDGDPKWETETWAQRADLEPGVGFMIRHPDLAQAGGLYDQRIRLRRVAWVRSEINERGEILPVEGGRWAVPDLDALAVALGYQPVGDRDDVVRAVPVAPLEPGLYSLEFNTGGTVLRARLGVSWPGTDQRAYSAVTCVDRYVGTRPRYRTCAEQTRQMEAPGSQWLRLYLVAPDVMDDHQGRSLVVRGVVVNVSEDEQVAVPPLEAQVQTAGGELLHSWQFDPGIGALAPGASASFRTETHGAPDGAHSVHVRFAPN